MGRGGGGTRKTGQGGSELKFILDIVTEVNEKDGEVNEKDGFGYTALNHGRRRGFHRCRTVVPYRSFYCHRSYLFVAVAVVVAIVAVAV